MAAAGILKKTDFLTILDLCEICLYQKLLLQSILGKTDLTLCVKASKTWIWGETILSGGLLQSKKLCSESETNQLSA